MKYSILLLTSLVFGACSIIQKKAEVKDSRIKPWTDNPRYWQYKGQPVLLLGGTDNDNLFQNINLESHLDSLKAIGGNYIRNTMSDRDPDNERAFAMTANGRYDLSKWNDKYWNRFENMLKLTSKRDIIVQIEIWDRFDHSRDQWITDPYNPKNNINFTYVEAGLDSLYPSHPGKNEQPFFFTVPGLNNNETLLDYQKAFVAKMLSYSLKYGNALYCIDNETSGVEEWASFWAGYIREKSGGKNICITQMWDTWDVKADIHRRTLDHPERYQFIDISQNSQLPGYPNWENAQYIFNYIKDNPRPVNSTKIYGSDNGTWLDRGISSEHAIQSFFRNVLGGFASSRFHRPPSGLGLSQPSVNCIKTVRIIEEKVKMWEITPQMDLLKDVTKNEAYLSAKEGEKYVIYFPKGGNVKLDLSNFNKPFIVQWINTDTAEWEIPSTISGGKLVELDSENDKSCFVVLVKK